jgi:hypothetical protein
MTAPIEQAIDRVNERSTSRLVGVRLLPAVRVAPDSELTLTAPPEPMAVIMLIDPAEGAWRPIVLPPGTTWQLVPARPRAPRIVGLDGRALA